MNRWSTLPGTSVHPAPPRTELHGRPLLAARSAWIVLTVLIVGLSAASVPGAYSEYSSVCAAGAECRPYWRIAPEDLRALHDLGISVSSYAVYRLTADILYGLGFWAIGAVIFWRKSDNWVALFVSVMLVTFGALNMIELASGTVPLLARVDAVLSFLGYVAFVVAFYLFPDGRFIPGWTRWLVIVWTLYLASLYFLPDRSPYPGAWSSLLSAPIVISLLGALVFAQAYRYRRVSGPVERQQTKWVVLGLTSAIILSVLVILPAVFYPELLQPGAPKIMYALFELTATNLVLLLIPLSIGVAILRYRLWDVDVVINRTLVYGALTASVAGIYVLIVGSLGAILQARGSLAISLPAAGVVAILFAPLRQRLQSGVNRLMYGERDEPYRVLSRLGERLEATLEPASVLPTIVETVAAALKLPYAAISMARESGYEVAAAKGTPTGEETALPLTYGGRPIGELTLAPREPGDAFTPADMRLLRDLARQAEVAVHAVRLTADLQRSRERLVTAREEERRRLRRDLHDGLGPTLAGLSLGLDISLKTLRSEPGEAEHLLAELKSRTQEAVADVRRLVYGLRPPALDELGLVLAIREQAAGYGYLADDSEKLREDDTAFYVEAPEELPPLPAAVEVATYRIVQEAITNVARHARARSCLVRLAIHDARDELVLEVSDDGVGLPDGRRAGVGSSSMSERSEELGGTCTVSSNPAGGTRVIARLPLFAEDRG
ncbi:MAG TPA: histidine kinase [Rubrobacter sp.]|nr:histidine kinase [Rubrobacter sp.]